MLTQIRDASGRTLEDIADQLEVAISTVQRWEAQTMSIPSQRLPAIAVAYGCRINDIFEDDESEHPPAAPLELVSLWDRLLERDRKRAIRVLRSLAEDDDAEENEA